MMPMDSLRLLRWGSYGAPTRVRDVEVTGVHPAPLPPKGGTMSTHFTHTQLAVPCAAATLLLAACGSSASRPSGSTATTAATVAATGTPATAPGAPPGGGGGAST